jgi:hypothetical protein
VSVTEGDCEITPDNALVVIARELRGIRVTLEAMAYDPNCETVLGQIHTALNDNLQSFDDRGLASGTVADHLRSIAEAL